MNRRPLISGNWKMHHNHYEAIQTVQKLHYSLPKDIHERIYAETAKALRSPDVAKRLQDLDAEVSSSTPEQFSAFWKKEIEKYRKIIADAKIEA